LSVVPAAELFWQQNGSQRGLIALSKHVSIIAPIAVYCDAVSRLENVILKRNS
jgi:hypothetical protein